MVPDSYRPIEQLMRDSGHYPSSEQFATFLAAELAKAPGQPEELEKTVKALSIALGKYVKHPSDEAGGARCSFCGKPKEKVQVILTSIESNICDECLFSGLRTISETEGQWYLRFAFAVFRVVARAGFSLRRLAGGRQAQVERYPSGSE